MRESDLLALECIDANASSVVARISIAPGGPMRTSQLPGISQAACDLLPGLARHRCDCGSSHGILAELADTEIPHLIEHIALELMALAGSPRSIEGETSWDFARDGRGVFHVAIRSDDRERAGAALSEATSVVNALAERAGHGGEPVTSFDQPGGAVLSCPASSELLRAE